MFTHSNVAGVAQATIDVEVSFQGTRGAVLAMYQPKTIELPKNILLERLSKIEALKNKRTYLVSSVVTCPAYAMQVSDQGGYTLFVARFTFVDYLRWFLREYDDQVEICWSTACTTCAWRDSGWRVARGLGQRKCRFVVSGSAERTR